MMPNAERVTFTKKKKTVACPEPWRRSLILMRTCFRFGARKCPRRSCALKPRASTCW